MWTWCGTPPAAEIWWKKKHLLFEHYPPRDIVSRWNKIMANIMFTCREKTVVVSATWDTIIPDYNVPVTAARKYNDAQRPLSTWTVKLNWFACFCTRCGRGLNAGLLLHGPCQDKESLYCTLCWWTEWLSTGYLVIIPETELEIKHTYLQINTLIFIQGK